MIINLPTKAEFYGESFHKIMESDSRIKVLWGGRGGGKSTAVARRAIIKLMQEDYCKIIITRKVFRDVKDSIYDTIKTEIVSNGLGELFNFKVSPLEIECIANGNKVIARGFDKEDATKSIKDPTCCIYEEASQMDEDDFTTTSSSIRTKGAILEEFIVFNPIVKTPKPENHWLYKTFFKGNKGKSFSNEVVIELDDETVSYKYDVLHTTYHDNRNNLTPEYIAILEGYKFTNEYKYETETLGNWSSHTVQNKFATYFDKTKHVSERAVFNPRMPIYISLDFNLEPFGFIFSHKWVDSEGYHCHQFDEAKIENGDIEKGINHIKAKYGKYSYGFQITGDKMGARRDFGRSDKASYYDRIRFAFNLNKNQIDSPANPHHDNSRQDLNYVLIHFDDYIIHPSCIETIYDLGHVEADAYGKIIKSDRKNIAQKADFLDCKRYEANDKFIQKWLKAHRKTL